MADDLDDFLSELGISKDSTAAANPSTSGADSATDPNDFLDWLNEPAKPLAFGDNQTDNTVPTSVQTGSTPNKIVEATDNIVGNDDVSFISEVPTPPKLEDLPLPSLEETTTLSAEVEAVNEQPDVQEEQDEDIVRKDDLVQNSNEGDDFGFDTDGGQTTFLPSDQQSEQQPSVPSQFSFNNHDDDDKNEESDPTTTASSNLGFVEMPEAAEGEEEEDVQDQTVIMTKPEEDGLDNKQPSLEQPLHASETVQTTEESTEIGHQSVDLHQSFGFEEEEVEFPSKNDDEAQQREVEGEPTAQEEMSFQNHQDEQVKPVAAPVEFGFDDDEETDVVVAGQNQQADEEVGQASYVGYEQQERQDQPQPFDPIAALEHFEEEGQQIQSDQFGVEDDAIVSFKPREEQPQSESSSFEFVQGEEEQGHGQDNTEYGVEPEGQESNNAFGFVAEQEGQFGQGEDAELKEAHHDEFGSNQDFGFGEQPRPVSFTNEEFPAKTEFEAATEQPEGRLDAEVSEFELATERSQEQEQFDVGNAEFEAATEQAQEHEQLDVGKTEFESAKEQPQEHELEVEDEQPAVFEAEHAFARNDADFAQQQGKAVEEDNPFSLPVSSTVESESTSQTPTTAFNVESHITDFFMGTNTTGINTDKTVDVGEVAFSTGVFSGEGAKPSYDIQENDTGFQPWGEPSQQYQQYHQPAATVASSSALFEPSTFPSSAVREEGREFEALAYPAQPSFDLRDQDQQQQHQQQEDEEEEDVEMFRSKSISKPEQEDEDDFDFSYSKPTMNEPAAGQTFASPTSDSFLPQTKSSSAAQAVPRLDLSFSDIGSDVTPSQSSNPFQHGGSEFSRRDSRPSMSSVPPTPSSGAYAPLSSVRPIPPAERLALWSAALKAFQQQRPTRLDDDGSINDEEEDEDDEEDAAISDHSVCPRALEVLDSISTSKMQGARLVWALRRLWGGALGVRGIGFADRDFNVSDRTASLLRALFGFHDPELTLHLDQVTSFTWSRHPSLFGFYGTGGGDPSTPAVLELWDLGIVKVHAGFETPQSGSMFFAFGACASRRLQLLQSRTMEQVFALFDEINYSMRVSHDESSRWAIFSSRIARETPRTFRNLLSQVELDLSMLNDMPVYEDGTSDDYVEPSTEMTRPAQQLANDFEIDVPDSLGGIEDDERASLKSSSTGSKKLESASGSSVTDHQSSKPPTSAAGSTTTAATSSWSRWKDLATKTAKQWSEKLAGPIDSDDGSKAAYKRLTESTKPRRIRLVVLDQNHLGCKLALTKQGLMCVGNPASDAGKQMQQRGVKEGDLIHAVNGATILLLPPAMAEMVAQKQERPLYCTIGTTNDGPFARKLNKERFNEAKKMLMKPLSEFYARHGPSKVDRCEEILELYAGRERALLSGLVEKYGEMVPGDELLRCESGAAIVTADEVVDFLDHPDDKDHLLVDIRDITERADTGYFAASILYGHNDVTDRLREAKRTYLIGSGRAREFCIADPIRAKAEARLDLERTKIIVDRLWREGIKRVSIVSGGFSQLYKEVKSRGVDCLITAQGSGTDFKLMELYLNLDFENPMSAAQFLTGHLSAKPPKQRRSSSVTSEATETLYPPQPPPSVGSSTLVHRGSTHSSTRRSNPSIHDASSQLAAEEDEDDDLFLPDPPLAASGGPTTTSATMSVGSAGSGSVASSAAAKAAASAAAKDMAAMASNTWSKWVAPALNKRKQSEQ